jgi:hypothetical protein
MNHRLSDDRIRATCRALLMADGRVSGRGLRTELRKRFGAVGRTARVFGIWREEARAPRYASLEVAELHRQLAETEVAARENLARVERAELREQAHQDHWALKIDELRQELRARPKYAAEIRALQEQVLRLTAELAAARNLLSSRG